jgi:hypothetical protein
MEEAPENGKESLHSAHANGLIDSFSPELHIHTRDFPLSADGLARSQYNCQCLPSSSSICSFSVLDLRWFLIFWAAVSYVI